jgi:hypothetical protein
MFIILAKETITSYSGPRTKAEGQKSFRIQFSLFYIQYSDLAKTALPYIKVMVKLMIIFG